MTISNDKRERSLWRDFFGKVRPQVMIAIIILGVISYVAIQSSSTAIVTGAVTGIIILGKEVIASDDR